MTNIVTNITGGKSLETSLHSNQAVDQFVGISSGISVSGALELAKCPENKGKKIVIILSENGEPYFTTGLYPKSKVKTKAPDLFWSF